MPVALYDPLAPDYSDPAALRGDFDRTFQKCSDCRVCVRLCPSFKSLFQMIDAYDDGATDVRVLTDAQQTRVVDECFQCKLCYVVCPYTPEKGQDWRIDFPGLMLRALLTKNATQKASMSARLLARTDLQGKVATRVAPIVNATSKVGVLRTVMEKTTGISRERLLPSFARVRFSKWFKHHTPVPAAPGAPERRPVALFPTCMVEYQNPAVGKAIVKVYEHNGIACTLPEGEVCCGMPWLDAGDRGKFEEHARRNVGILADVVRSGADIVVTQPTCGYVLKHEYPTFLQTDDARLVGEHTYDASEYLIASHREQPLDTEFPGPTYETIIWHAACHQRAQQIGPKSRDVMALTGAKVTMIERCAGIDGTWGLRAENVAMAKQVAKPLMTAVRESESDLVAGDCHLANNAMLEETGKTPVHPFEVIARAYGIDLETDVRKLTLTDIVDQRAYERERDDFRTRIIAMKKRRRIALGDIMTIVFENFDTMRFQVQEMARAERMLRDEQIETEIAIYNELIPDPGELAGTLFIEIPDPAGLREWLPKLPGVQRTISIDVAGTVVPGEPIDEERLTREDEITSTVHYLRFVVPVAVRGAFAAGPVSIRVDHPEYQAVAVLGDEQRGELASDLAAGSAA